MRSTTVVGVVESLARHKSRGSISWGAPRDSPPFVAKAVQEHLASASLSLLQAFVQQHVLQITEIVTDAFGDRTLRRMEENSVLAPRPFVAEVKERVIAVAVEAGKFLPQGEPLPSSLVCTPSADNH
jgi:hypothetical protein